MLCYFRSRNFRKQKRFQISRILAKLVKGYGLKNSAKVHSQMFMPAKFFHSFNFFPFFSQRFHPKTWACFRNFFFFESITLKITLIFFYFLFWVLCFLLKKKRKEEKKKKREKIQFMLAKSLTENTIEPVPEENVFYNQVSATKRVLSNFVRGKFQKFHVS